MSQKLQAAILGLGWYGTVHLDYLLTRADVEVAALASSNPEKLRAAAAKAPGARLYPSHAELLAGEQNLDILFVCVPPHTHAGVERQAAGMGINLFVEKPLDVHWAEAAANLEAIEKAGVVAAVGYQKRYAPGMAEARSITLEGPVGLMQGTYVVDMPTARWWRQKATSGGQVVEQTTHVLDLMRWFAGEAETAEAIPVRGVIPPGGFDTDDASAALIRFAGGGAAMLASGCFNVASDVPERMSLNVFCPSAQVDFDFIDGLTLRTAAGNVPYGSAKSAHAAMVDTFINAVKTGDTAPIRSTYADALETFRLSLAVEQAIVTGERVAVQGATF